MPNVTIKSLQKENNTLKDEIAALRKNFDSTSEVQCEVQWADNGGHTCPMDPGTTTHLEVYGK